MNWGRAIILIFILFASGIGYLVYKATQTEFDLVEDDYYEKELNYQSFIDQRNRAIEKGMEIQFQSTATEVLLSVSNTNQSIQNGSVLFYDATNRENDRTFELPFSEDAHWIISKDKLSKSAVSKGAYTVKMSWVINRDTFRSERRWTP